MFRSYKSMVATRAIALPNSITQVFPINSKPAFLLKTSASTRTRYIDRLPIVTMVLTFTVTSQPIG